MYINIHYVTVVLFSYMYSLGANIQYCYYQLTILAHLLCASLIITLGHRVPSCAVWSAIGPYQKLIAYATSKHEILTCT